MDTMFKAAFVTGIDDALVDARIYQWPNEEIRLEVTAKIAEEIGGGPTLEQYPVPREGVTFVADRLIKAANYLQSQGYQPTNEQLQLTKQAAQYDLNTRAAVRAEEWMKIAAYLKQAEQESLTQVGKNTPEESAGNDQTGRLDWNNRPEGKYNLGFGKTNFPDGGVVGKQMFTEEKASGKSKDNSLQHLDKQAEDPTLLDAIKGVPGKVFDFGKQHLYENVKNMPEAIRQAQGFGGTAKALGHGLKGPAALLAAAGTAYGGKKLYDRLTSPSLNEPISDQSLDHLKLLQESQRPHLKESAVINSSARKNLYSHLTNNQEKNAQVIAKFASAGATAMQAFDAVIPGAMRSKLAHVVMAGLYEHQPNPDVAAHRLIAMTKQANDEGMSPEDILQQILQQQGEVGEQASPELIAAIQQALAEQGDEGMAEETAEAPPPENPNAMPPKEAANKLAELANARKANSSNNLLDRLKRAADGSLTDSSENTPGEAAKDDQTAALDQKNRPEGKYNKGFGNTDLKSPGQGYTQKKAPGADTANTQNSLTPSEKEAAEEYNSNLRKVANAYADQLPAHLSREEKVAHLQHMLSLPPHQRVPYVKSLF